MDSKITTLGTLTETASGDLIVVVDISDASMSASGTTKKFTLGALKAYVLTGLTTGAAWGSITGALSAQSDLVTAFNALNASNLTSGTVAAARGGAGTISGILKANGSGVVSLAVAGTDYVTVAQVVSVQDSLAASISGKQSVLTFSTGLTLVGSTLSVTNPYNPAAVAITGGTMSGVTITGSPISGSTGAFTTLGVDGLITLASGDGFIRIANGANSLITGSAAGDFAMRINGGSFMFSTDGGTSGVKLAVPVANTLALRNSTANQTLSIGAASGTGGGVLVLHQSASAPTSSSGDGKLFVVSGEVNAMDDSGNVSVISPHAKDAPAELYEVGPGVDEMLRRANVFLCVVNWWATTRRQLIDALDMRARLGAPEDSALAWAEVLARRASGRVSCAQTETFAEYEARTCKSLVPADQDKAEWLAMTPAQRWQKVEADRVAKSQAGIEAWQARKTALVTTAQATEFTEAKPIPYAAAEVPEFLQ